MFQTDSDEDVVFVSEKSAPKHIEIPVDKTKRLALQRDIDQQSRPKEPATPSSSQKFVALERQVEMVKRKMEQEISEENLIKKERKRKKGQVDDRSLAEVKKEKKKGKIVDAVVTEGKSWDENCEKDKKKKKRKPSDFFNDASVSQITDAKDDSKKKKKKKLLADSENQVETAECLVKEDGVEKKQKKKVKNKTAQIKLENTVKEEEEEEEQQQVEKDHLPKKTKKGKKHILTINSEETEKQIKEKTKKCPLSVNEITVTKTEKKAEVAENGILETPEYEVEEVKIKKKTKKDAKTKDYGNGVETTEIKGKNKKSNAASDKGLKDKKMLCKKEDKSAGIDFITEDKGKTELKKKAKKDKCKIATVEVDEEPKKKKGKKAKHEEEELLLDKSEEVMEDKQSDDTPKKKGKKKKSFAQVEHASKAEDELGAKKKKNKIKKEKQDPEESPQVDVVFLSEKSGNTDEITINQERRQALQMEIDEASQPEKPAKPTGFGQWSTAQFDSSEQQQKFLRLMGGFKKGFQSDVVSTGGANMALGKDAQQQLHQGLQGEFERAHSRRMDFNNRGAGLGFSAPSNKKFSIDINACRSVRFDD